MAVARTSRKGDRLELRIEPERRHLLDEAASETGMSTSAFVLSHATAAAQHVLADRVRFVLPTEHWDAFVDSSTATSSQWRVAALFAGPSVEDLA